MDEIVLNDKLAEIAKTCENNYHKINDVGVLAGLSGISMFLFYYSKFIDEIRFSLIGQDILNRSIQIINDGHVYPTYCNGIAGLGWAINHLEKNGFLEKGEGGWDSSVDDYLYFKMLDDLKKGNYDFLHGSIGYALYFLKRFELLDNVELKYKYKMNLIEFIRLLKKTAVKESNEYYWAFPDPRAENGRVNFSLSHGMASIIAILTKLNGHQDYKFLTDEMLLGAIKFVMRHKKECESTFSFFPNWISEDGAISNRGRMAWCYGDLGISIQLWHSAMALKDNNLKKDSLEILKKCINRTSYNETRIDEAALCHGSFGVAQIFLQMYKQTNDLDFKKAYKYWVGDGIGKAVHLDGFAGFKKYYPRQRVWANDASLLSGIAGIGLTIIDVLADFDTNWNECLMIS